MDLLALWVLTLLNTFTIALILRQLALRPQLAVKREGPPVGSTMPTWSLDNLDGQAGLVARLPPSHVLVFASTNCGPCHDLFRDLASHPVDTKNLAYLVIDQDAVTVRQTLKDVPSGAFAGVFIGSSPALLANLHVPATPYGVAIRDGRVVEARTVNRGGLLQALVASASASA